VTDTQTQKENSPVITTDSIKHVAMMPWCLVLRVLSLRL